MRIMGAKRTPSAQCFHNARNAVLVSVGRTQMPAPGVAQLKRIGRVRMKPRAPDQKIFRPAQPYGFYQGLGKNIEPTAGIAEQQPAAGPHVKVPLAQAVRQQQAGHVQHGLRLGMTPDDIRHWILHGPVEAQGARQDRA